MLIELFEGFFVNPEAAVVVKATGEGQCALFTAGQSATDGGFTVPYDAAEVAEQINDACEELYGKDEEDEEDDAGRKH
jgi:hypothetical protein